MPLLSSHAFRAKAVLIDIARPFLSIEDFRLRAGERLARLVSRLAERYSRLLASCGWRRMLMALSVAWGMTAVAAEGRVALLEHIDEAIQPVRQMSLWMEPKWGCVVVGGAPFLVVEEEGEAMRDFLWDGFALFIEQEGTGRISQEVFDLADLHQSKAYLVMREDARGTSRPAAGGEGRAQESRMETPLAADPSAAPLDTPRPAASPAAMEEAPAAEANTDLADLVDAALKMADPAVAEALSLAMDRLGVESSGEAQQRAVDQARRLHYRLERLREEAEERELRDYELNKRKGTTTMGDSYTFNVQGDYVKGDKVMGNKYVGQARGEEEERLRAALERLMEEQGSDGKPLFQTQAQWYAVYRILVDDYGWKEGALSDFCRRIGRLGVKWRVGCKADCLKRINQTSPFYKAFSEWEPQGSKAIYDRQALVAERFRELMEEE